MRLKLKQTDKEVWYWSPTTPRGWIRYIRIQLARWVSPKDYQAYMDTWERLQGELIVSVYKDKENEA